MELSIAKRLSEGVGSYLHYSFCCNKAGLFNEDLLKFSVGAIPSTVLPANNGTRRGLPQRKKYVGWHRLSWR